MPEFRRVPEWGKSKRSWQSIARRALRLLSRERKLIRDRSSSSRARARAGTIAKYNCLPAGVFMACGNISTRAAVAGKMRCIAEASGRRRSLFSAHSQRLSCLVRVVRHQCAAALLTAAVIAAASCHRSVSVPPPDRGIEYHSCRRGKITKREFNGRIVASRLLSRGEGVGGVG
jgi:hypothetical protein